MLQQPYDINCDYLIAGGGGASGLEKKSHRVKKEWIFKTGSAAAIAGSACLKADAVFCAAWADPGLFLMAN